MENKKKKINSFTPCHLSSFSSDPLHGSKLVFFVFFLFCRGFCHLGPKMPQNPRKNQKNKETKKFHPMSPVQLLLRPSPWVETFFWLSRGFCHCVSPTISVAYFFVFFVFLFLRLLGEICTLTTSIGTAFTPPPFILMIDVFIELLILATEPTEKMYSKNSSITHLFRHSTGLMFYWYAEVAVPHL